MSLNHRAIVLLLVGLIGFSESVLAVSDADKKNAKRLYERLTGVKVNSSNADLLEVAKLLADGDKNAAVSKITKSSDFINVQIRNLALRLSNKDESVKVGFSDFAALIVGAVRDNRDFRTILTGDYYYLVGNQTSTADPRARLFTQTNFTGAESSYVDLNKNLLYRANQTIALDGISSTTKATDAGGSIVKEVNQPDAAGVLTTRTFAERNISGGTNRRAVEFALKQFLCVSMADAADSSASDQYVGKDVERFPAGDHNKYLTSCKSCHAVMDGMRPAFAKYEFTRYVGLSGTSHYGMMNGDTFNQEEIAAARTDYNTNVVRATRDVIIPDLEKRQMTSTYYTTRYNRLIEDGGTPEQAKATLMRVLNNVRDTTLLATQASEYGTAQKALIDDIRAKRTDTETRTLYSATCVNYLGNSALTAAQQTSNFLICDLDRRQEASLLYIAYQRSLRAANVDATESSRLLNKMINKDRDDDVILQPYLQIVKKARLFPNNGFDSATGIATKMNKGSYVYGFTVRSDQFVNNANLGNKAEYFGWRGPNKDGGSGVKAFGRMLSDSRRFSQCMAKRTYESVCLKKMDSTQQATLARLGDRFEALNYNLRNFYGEVALDPSCGIIQGESSL